MEPTGSFFCFSCVTEANEGRDTARFDIESDLLDNFVDDDGILCAARALSPVDCSGRMQLLHEPTKFAMLFT